MTWSGTARLPRGEVRRVWESSEVASVKAPRPLSWPMPIDEPDDAADGEAAPAGAPAPKGRPVPEDGTGVGPGWGAPVGAP